MALATNVKNIKYSVWCKLLCIVLTIMLCAHMTAGALLTVLATDFEFASDEKEFFSSSRIVNTLADSADCFVETSLVSEENKGAYDELMSQEDEVVSEILEQYETTEAKYKLYEQHDEYSYEYELNEDEDEQTATTVVINSGFDNVSYEKSVTCSRGEFIFAVTFYDIYYRDGYTAKEAISQQYENFVDENTFSGSGVDYYNSMRINAPSMKHALYLDGKSIGIGENKQSADELIKQAKDNGYYFIYTDGAVDYSSEVFDSTAVKTLTEQIASSCEGTENITYLFCINMDSLYDVANEEGIHPINMLTKPSSLLMQYWVFNMLSSHSLTAAMVTKSQKTAVAMLIVEFVLLCAVVIFYFTVTGRREKNGEVRLCFKDYIPIELHFILAVGLAAIPFGVFSELAYQFTYFSLYFLFAAVVCAVTVSAVLLGFCGSVYRAIRSKRDTAKFFVTVYTLQLIKKAVMGVIKLLSYKPKCFKRNIIIIGILYIALSSFLTFSAGAMLSGDSLPVAFVLFVLWALLNGFVLYTLGKYTKQLDEVIISSVNSTDITDLDRLYTSLQYLAGSNRYKNAELQHAVEQAVKDERLRSELITNVSHDLKTPLTSIINYVDLLSNCDIEDENAKKYIAVLNEKGARLKRLIDDLIEASKVTSGAISINPVQLNLYELCIQAIAEAQESFDRREVELVINNCIQPVEVMADGAKAYRVIENLLSNAAKYSALGSRVYISVYKENTRGVFEIKNISEKPLNIEPEELTQRFVRGDSSRSDEGNGLGLSIAKELCKAQGGSLEITIDGDLFKARVILPS